MVVKVSVDKTDNLIDLDFNKELGIKPINIQDKFIGINTKDKGFQKLFGKNPVVNRMFSGGYSKNFSAGFKAGPVNVNASTKLTFGSLYAKLGIVASAKFDLGGAKIGAKKSGSADLVSFVPETGNGIRLSARTIAAFGAAPSASFKLPTASLKVDLLGDTNVAGVSLDSKLSGGIKYKRFNLSGSTDLPKVSFPGSIQAQIYKKDKKGKISPINLINFNLSDIAAGKPKPGSKKGTKGTANLFDFEIKGVKITSDIRNPFANAIITPNNSRTAPSITLSNRIPLVTASTSLNKLASNGYPLLKLLAKKIKRNAYDVDYKLLDLSIGSDLKIGYTGTIGLSGYYSRATLEDSQTLNLNSTANQYSNVLNVLNTTDLKKVLDADGDGKATIKFSFGYNSASLKLDYGLYANLFAQLEIGKLSVDVGSKIGFSNRFVDISRKVGGKIVDFGPAYKGRLDILKDIKLPLPKGLSGSKSIALNASPYQFSENTTFNIPANADDLIKLLGLNPADFYILKGTNGNDALTTRTERGNDMFYGYAGNDTMIGGLGDDTYYIDSSSDVVIEEANAGNDTIISSISYTLPEHVEVLDLRSATVGTSGTGNSLSNIIYGGAGTDNLAGGVGDDTYIINGSLDIVSELANAGVDTIVSSVSYALPGNVEVLDLRSATISVTGTDFHDDMNNIFYGSSSSNSTLYGYGGNDRLEGGSGDDTLIDVSGNNTLVGGAGRDYLTGSDSGNVLVGGSGADRFKFSDYSWDGSSPVGVNIINDFEIGIDKIEIGYFRSSYGYGGSPNIVFGSISGSYGPTVSYDRNTGNLAYDSDGAFPGYDYAPTIIFAKLENKPYLYSSDFVFQYQG